MSGAAIDYELQGLDQVLARLRRMANFDRRRLMDIIGATVESQTRRRIEEDKTGPDGARWQAWSDRHALTRHSGHSLLEGEGDLDDSITHNAYVDRAEIGSNLIYAATHQFGDADRNIPARPFLGLSAADEIDVLNVVEAFIEREMSR